MARISDIFRLNKAKGPSEEERLASIKKIVEQSSTGKKVLDEAYQKNPNLKIKLLGGMDNYGSYSSIAGRIYLSADYPDFALVTALVHEARHAAQEDDIAGQASLKSMIMSSRACEADAMAYEAAAAYELGGIYQKLFNEEHPGVASAYAGSLTQSKDQNEALLEGFKAWFDDQEYVEKYDNNIIKRTNSTGFGRASEQFSSAMILRAACPEDENGKSYVAKEMTLLDQERFRTITLKTALMARYTAFWKGDNSIYGFSVRQKDGSAKPLKSVTKTVLSALAKKRESR